MSNLKKAIELSKKYHKNQVDKNGEDYLNHLFRVMNSFQVEREKERIVAVMHDIIEDTSCTYETLEGEGFSTEVIDAIDCLTRKKDEKYFDYITRILYSNNYLAISVKLKDLEDNMGLEIDRPVPGNLLSRYVKAKAMLEHAKIVFNITEEVKKIFGEIVIESCIEENICGIIDIGKPSFRNENNAMNFISNNMSNLYIQFINGSNILLCGSDFDLTLEKNN